MGFHRKHWKGHKPSKTRRKLNAIRNGRKWRSKKAKGTPRFGKVRSIGFRGK